MSTKPISLKMKLGLFLPGLFLPVLLLLAHCQTHKDAAIQKAGPIVRDEYAIDKTDRNFVGFLDRYMDSTVKRHDFSGVVLYARGDDILFHRAYGLAERGRYVPVNTETRFNLASASKMFTAVAVASLVERGKLSFDDPIGDCLGADWISEEAGSKVRVRHLLNHTSGFGHYWDDYDSYKDTLLNLDDYRILISGEPAFEPGSAYRYSNSGYILLGAIIEKVTGQSYFEYVQEVIFDPCGMGDTEYFKMDGQHSNLATG